MLCRTDSCLRTEIYQLTDNTGTICIIILFYLIEVYEKIAAEGLEQSYNGVGTALLDSLYYKWSEG